MGMSIHFVLVSLRYAAFISRRDEKSQYSVSLCPQHTNCSCIVPQVYSLQPSWERDFHFLYKSPSQHEHFTGKIFFFFFLTIKLLWIGTLLNLPMTCWKWIFPLSTKVWTWSSTLCVCVCVCVISISSHLLKLCLFIFGLLKLLFKIFFIFRFIIFIIVTHVDTYKYDLLWINNLFSYF